MRKKILVFGPLHRCRRERVLDPGRAAMPAQLAPAPCLTRLSANSEGSQLRMRRGKLAIPAQPDATLTGSQRIALAVLGGSQDTVAAATYPFSSMGEDASTFSGSSKRPAPGSNSSGASVTTSSMTLSSASSALYGSMFGNIAGWNSCTASGPHILSEGNCVTYSFVR
jgi:hypothetical protein